MPVKNKMRPPATIADEVRSIRESLGLTREEFAVRLGVSMRSIARWETGRAIHGGTLKRIRALSAAPPAQPPPQLRGVPTPGSAEDLHEMLDIILERAPETMVEAVTDFLFERAGRYGYFRSPSATRK